MMLKIWFSVIISSLIYSFFIASKIPKGKFRLISLLPVIYTFTVLPLHLSSVSVLFTGLSGLILTWLANFKLLLFAFQHDPPTSSFWQFTCFTCLPIKIKPTNPKFTKSPSKLSLNYPTKVAAFAAFVCLLDYRDALHPYAILLIYIALLYLLFEVVFGLVNYLVRGLSGIELESPSDDPYLATSLQDFWGRRWNLMVTDILRDVVYRPVRSWVGTRMGKRWAPLAAAVGVLGAFLVSGLMHELLFYYVTRAAPTWEVTCFFVLHGVCLVVEYGLKRLLMGKLRLRLGSWS